MTSMDGSRFHIADDCESGNVLDALHVAAPFALVFWLSLLVYCMAG